MNEADEPMMLPGCHVYVFAPDAVIVVPEPTQTEAELAVMVGPGETTTCVVCEIVELPTHPPKVAFAVYTPVVNGQTVTCVPVAIGPEGPTQLIV